MKFGRLKLKSRKFKKKNVEINWINDNGIISGKIC